MKHGMLKSGTLSLLITCAALPAQADNAVIEDALKSRNDLSSFYNALVVTGVIHELQPNRPYTVFAPTNEAFSDVEADKYPCFYSSACRDELADILRNHIIPNETHVTDLAKHSGGIFSIDKRHVRVGKSAPNNYIADGKNVISTNQLAGSILYKIDGVIANDAELAQFREPAYVYVPSDHITTMTEKKIHTSQCTETHCPPAGEETTVTTTTTLVPVPVSARND